MWCSSGARDTWPCYGKGSCSSSSPVGKRGGERERGGGEERGGEERGGERRGEGWGEERDGGEERGEGGEG